MYRRFLFAPPEPKGGDGASISLITENTTWKNENVLVFLFLGFWPLSFVVDHVLLF